MDTLFDQTRIVIISIPSKTFIFKISEGLQYLVYFMYSVLLSYYGPVYHTPRIVNGQVNICHLQPDQRISKNLPSSVQA